MIQKFSLLIVSNLAQAGLLSDFVNDCISIYDYRANSQSLNRKLYQKSRISLLNLMVYCPQVPYKHTHNKHFFPE